MNLRGSTVCVDDLRMRRNNRPVDVKAEFESLQQCNLHGWLVKEEEEELNSRNKKCKVKKFFRISSTICVRKSRRRKEGGWREKEGRLNSSDTGQVVEKIEGSIVC